MLTSLTLPALVLVGGITGIPGLHWLKGVKLKRPPPPPADSLPPVWKTPSRLALENQFVRAALPPLQPGPVGLKVKSDPRRLRVAFRPDSGLVSAVPELGEVPLRQGSMLSLPQFTDDLTRRSFQRQWSERNAQYLRQLAQQSPTPSAGGLPGLSFRLPSPLPRQVQSLLGPGGPALNVSGSENIRLSGTSSWTNLQVGPQGRRQSLFPSLDMQQDLDIRLEGQLSDRIRVNLLQNSGIQIPLANRIAVNYRGDEDDLVQNLDLGNTNLSLPGTQYVSYSGKNEGLFGAKSTMRVGPLDFTILASKQEGKSERASYAGGTSQQRNTLADADYMKGVYFFLYDPNLDVLDIQSSDIRLYLDDYNYSNDQNSIAGRAFVDTTLTCVGCTDTTSVRGTFTPLNPGADQDYELLDIYGPRFRVIRLRRQISNEQRLAVTYVARRIGPGGVPEAPFAVGGQDSLEADGVRRRFMKLLRPPATLVKPNLQGLYDRSSPFNFTRDLELRNFYQLPGQRIDPASFTLTIRRGVDDPPVVSVLGAGGVALPYIELLGLDSYDQTQAGGLVRGHDGRVDGTYLDAASRQAFVDYDNGILFLPDPRPFAPRIGPAYLDVSGPQPVPRFPFDQAVSNALNRRDSLVGHPDSLNGQNVAIYDKHVVLRSLDTRYFIDVEFTAARAVGEINLRRGNILEGSDVVAINGQALVRDRDYTIDYDLGRVQLKRQLGPADQLNIDYSYAPLFQQAGRTLIGSAFRLEGRDKSLGGAFMYESKGAQDLRPRLGEEPSRSVIGDLNTAWTFRPDWITRLVDRLPGVRTTAPSEFAVQAEVGASFPNPNTKNVVYIDDMEGVRDAVSVAMSPERWTLSGVPLRDVGGLEIPLTDTTLTPRTFHTELRWYSPVSAVKERDLKPNLTDAQGAQTSRQVLALSVPQRPTTQGITATSPLWAGLTFPLDQYGLDLSRAQFIEVWVNDFNDLPRVRDRHVKLRIDLGVVSEDQMRSPEVPPNGLLDTEDRSEGGAAPDRQLDVSGSRNEDTGLDGRLSPAEIGAGVPVRNLSTASAADPEGDDFRLVPEGPAEDMDPARFRFANGTENNHTVNPNPDTEDLNLDNVLQTRNEYFEYTIDLCDTCRTYLVTDVKRDFASPIPPNPVRPDNGWRRYRIPIQDERRVRFGVPDLTLARHVRVWVDSVVDPDPAGAKRPLLMLGGLEIVGSRWQVSALTGAQVTAKTTITLNALNTVDNAGEYRAPFDPGAERSGGQPVGRREQSLALEFENLAPDDTLEVFKTFSIDENYSRYGQLTWWVGGFKVRGYSPAVDSLEYFVRFASDEIGRNYYEYKAKLPLDPDSTLIGWREIRVKLTDLSNLKLRGGYAPADTLYAIPGPAGDDRLGIRGRPSFTRLRRVSFGIVNPHRDPLRVIPSGRLLFNELRATEVARDAGYAKRLLVNGRLSNLLSYNLSYNGRDANFQSVGESRGSGNSNDQLGLGTTIDLHRFFEATGIVLPLGLSYARNTSRPRFSAGDDVLRTGALERESETRSETRSMTTSYSRQWSDRSNPLLRFTLGGITANYARNQSEQRNPTNVGSSTTRSASVNYGIAPRSLLVLGVPGTKLRLHPLPERLYWNYSVSTSESRLFDRLRDGGGLVPRSSLRGRSAFINFGGDTRPFEFFRHHFEGVRNLTLPEHQREQIGFINLGKVVTWRQNMDARYALNRGPWVNPALGWASNYSQDNRPELSRDLSVRAIGNSQGLTASWSLPFDRLKPAPARSVAADTSRKVRAPSPFAWRPLLSRLGNFTADAALNRSSGYSRLTGTAHFLYLVGLSDNPGLEPNGGGRMQELFGNTVNKAQDWRTSARTRFDLGLDAGLAMRGEVTWRRNEYNRVASRTVTSRFPDLEVDYGKLPAYIRLNRVLNNPRLRTAFSRARVYEYRNDERDPTSVSTSSQWQPLLGLGGEFKNQTRAELKIERRVTVRENFQFGISTRTDRNTDVNLSLNRSYSRGQKVKILGRESTIRSSVQLGLTTVYSRTSGETFQAGSRRQQLPVDQDRLSVNGTGSYSFSNNVTGGVVLGFGQNRDLLRQITSRNVRVELRASFSF